MPRLACSVCWKRWAPGNADALAGLNRVALEYRDLASGAYKRGDFPGALAMIERGLQVEPGNSELRQMHGEHEQLLDEARAARTRAAAAQADRDRQSNPIKRAWNNIFGQ